MADRHAESYQDPGKFGGVDWPSQDAEAVTPSNTVDLANVSRALYIGVGGTVVVEALKATLRVASGEAHTLTQTSPVGSFDPGTVATMADGNDATGSLVRGVNEGSPPSVTYREEWTLDEAAVSGDISLVRVIARTKLVDGTAGLDAQGTYRPSWGGADRGAEHAVGAAANDSQEFAVDPADGQPWTNAKINALKWGWFLHAFVGSDAFDDVVDVMCVDFKLEIWGP